MLDPESLIENSNFDVFKRFKELEKYAQEAPVVLLPFRKLNDLNDKMNNLWWDSYLSKK